MKKLLTLFIVMLLVSISFMPISAETRKSKVGVIGENDSQTIEVNDDETKSIIIKLKNTGKLTLQVKGTNDKNAYMEFKISAENLKDEGYYYLENAFGNLNFKGDYWFNAGEYTITFEARKKSTFVITTKLTSSNETNEIKETLNKDNNALSKAQTIKFDKEYKGMISRSDADDYYKFELKDLYTIPHIYYSDVDMSVEILDSNGEKVVPVYDNDSNLNYYGLKDLRKGVYYLHFHTASNGYSGNYTFKLTKTYQGWLDDEYWYEKGVRQGVYGDPKNNWYDGTERGREIYDEKSDGWYWLDANAQGKKATLKEVFMPYVYQQEKSWSDKEKRSNSYASNNVPWAKENALLADQVYYAMTGPVKDQGKWVRYDKDGKMFKGWTKLYYWPEKPSQEGNVYYYDEKTGLMAKGDTVIDGKTYKFDKLTGVCSNPPKGY